MSVDQKMDSSRRTLLLATSAAGGVAAVATAVPFVASLTPSERAKAAGAPVEADISKLAPGEMMTVEWRGKPTVILAHTVKGKGVSYMENQAKWHGAAPDEAQYRLAMDELTTEVP